MVVVAQPPDHAAPPSLVRIPATWAAFVELLEAKGEAPWPKLTYWGGEIEIEMAPGMKHETVKKRIAQLLTVYFEAHEIDLRAWGSTTLKHPNAAGAEPDESYAFEESDRPDLVIEVIVTSGGIDKLEIYAVLGVPEVWLWDDREGLTVHVLEGAEYKEAATSQLLPELDLSLFVRHLDEPSDLEALRAYRRALIQS